MKKANRLAPIVLVASIGVGAGSAGVAAAPAGATVVYHVMAPVTKTGRLSKIDSKMSFTLAVGMHRYVVKIDDMTHIKLDGKTVKFSSLKVGDTLTVRGPLQMKMIDATSVAVHM